MRVGATSSPVDSYPPLVRNAISAYASSFDAAIIAASAGMLLLVAPDHTTRSPVSWLFVPMFTPFRTMQFVLVALEELPGAFDGRHLESADLLDLVLEEHVDRRLSVLVTRPFGSQSKVGSQPPRAWMVTQKGST